MEKALTFGDLIANFYNACGKGFLRLAVKATSSGLAGATVSF